MENEHTTLSTPSYWPSVVFGAVIVSLLTSVVGTILMYYVANAEPSMTLMVVSGLFIPITCLLGLIGGILSTRHYAKTYDITFPIGTGAIIGLLTGVVAALISTVISQVWMLIDPTLMENFASNLGAALEQMNMPQEQKEQTMSSMMENMERNETVGGVLMGTAINAGILGVVNLITGMIGAKIFASEEEQY